MNGLWDNPKCENCNDTGWIRHPEGGGHFCQICRPGQQTAGMQAAADVVAEVARRMKDVGAKDLSPLPHSPLPHADLAERVGTIPAKDMELREYQLARLVAEHDAEHPIQLKELVEETGLGEREIKGIFRTLRDLHALPIGASRQKPFGYYWITTKEGFLSYYHTARAQAMAELVTLEKMARKHWPELAGQMKLPEIETH